MLLKKEIVKLLLKENGNNFYQWSKNQLDLLVIFYGKTASQKYFFPHKEVNFFDKVYYQSFYQVLNKTILINRLRNNQLKFTNSQATSKIIHYLALTLPKKKFLANFASQLKGAFSHLPQNQIEKELFQTVAKRGFLQKDDMKIIANKLNKPLTVVRSVYYRNKLLLKYKTEKEKNYALAKARQIKNKIFLQKGNFQLVHQKYWINQWGKCYKEVSGSLKSVHWLLRTNQHNSRYYILSINGKHVFLHKLLAATFLANPKRYRYIKMKNNNFLDLQLTNMQWIKYPAITRIQKGLDEKRNTWLNFIKKHFQPGIVFKKLAKILAEKAEELSLFPNNHNKINTIQSIIKKYSTTNETFPIFVIKWDRNQEVFLNEEDY